METFCFNHYILSDDSKMGKQSKARETVVSRSRLTTAPLLTSQKHGRATALRRRHSAKEEDAVGLVLLDEE